MDTIGSVTNRTSDFESIAEPLFTVSGVVCESLLVDTTRSASWVVPGMIITIMIITMVIINVYPLEVSRCA